MRNAALERLIWILIFGGLIVFSVGLFVHSAERGLRWSLLAVGAVAAGAGVVLVGVRARRPD